MALRPRITTEDHKKLSKDVAAEYKADGDNFVLDVTPENGWALEDVKGLQSALGKEKENARQAKERLTAFGDLDPVAARDAVGKVTEMASWTPEQKVREQIEAKEKGLQTAFGKEKATLETQIKVLKSSLEETLITSAAISAITAEKGVPELLLPSVTKRIRMRQDPGTGKFIAEVLQEDGQTPMVVDSSGTPQTVAGLVKELKGNAIYGRAFDASGASGSGASGGSKGGTSGGAVRSVSITDARGLSDNLEAIAAGTVNVTPQ